MIWSTAAHVTISLALTAGSVLSMPANVSVEGQHRPRFESRSFGTDSKESTTGAYGSMVLTHPPAPDQWYFWTKAWQREEAQSLRDLSNGDFASFEDIEDALSWLDDPDS